MRNANARLETRHDSVSSDQGRVIYGCHGDAGVRNRVQAALRGHATIEWHVSFARLHEVIETRGRMSTVIIGMRDKLGETAEGFALAVRGSAAGTAIIACCAPNDKLQSISGLAIAGVHDVLFIGVNDDGHSARMVIFGASLGGAADAAMSALGSTIPAPLATFVDMALRRPRELRRVADVAAAMNIPRQTLSRWCRVTRFVGPEELLTWSRLLLVTALLESTDRTLESIAYEMQYGSPTALRNRIREYSGLTATQLRDHGIDLMMTAFSRRIEAVRRGQGAEKPGQRARALTG